MKSRMSKWGAIILVLSLILTGCGGAGGEKKKNSASASAASKEVSKKVEVREAADIDKLLVEMSLEEKAGQMLQAERGDIKPDEVRRYYVGSIMSAGGSIPEGGKTDTKPWIQMITAFQEAAKKTPHQIPIIYGIDAVHGHNSVSNATIFPHNIGLGAADDTELMKKIGEITAKEMLATGINWTFAPCMPVARDPRWGRYYESYGESSEKTARLSRALIEGLQLNGAAATAKHYIGDGLTAWGTGMDGKIDRGNVTLSEEEIRKVALPSYEAAIKSGVKTIMLSFSSTNDIKMHANKYWVTDVLKGELGFQGIVVTDFEGIREIPAKNLYDQVVLAADAGADLFMEPYRWREVHSALVKAVKKGDISEERINDAVRRILKVKLEMGLFENPVPQINTGYEIGNQGNREVAQEAVRKSLVLLKNQNDILPLKKDTKVYVLGPAANNIGAQCGGWTVSWQGGEADITGKTILEGFKELIGENLITDKTKAHEADVVVLVIGERAHAEFQGDDAQLAILETEEPRGEFEPLPLTGNAKAIEKAKALGKPIVTIIVSGRPRIITKELENWDALVMAWLPGSEGQGVSEVLFEGNYSFTGKLPMNWPKSADAFPLKDENILFKEGYGLTY